MSEIDLNVLPFCEVSAKELAPKTNPRISRLEECKR